MVHQTQLILSTNRAGQMHDITAQVRDIVAVMGE